MLNWVSELSKREKVLLFAFFFTCFQLGTQIPYITLIPGERTKVFSGLLCGFTFFILLSVKKRKICLSIEWVVCIVLAALCILSGLGSSTPSSSLWRAVTLIFSAAGGFWCGRLILNLPFYRALFGRFCLFLLTFLLVGGAAGFFFYGDVLSLVGIHKHVLNGLIILLSFGPMQLLFNEKRLHKLAGVLYLLASSYVISLSFDPMIWFPPLLLLGGLLLSIKEKKRIFIPVILVFTLVGLFQNYKLPEYFFDKGSISIWVRVENVFFSWHIAQKHPLLGIGLVAPRSEYLEDYEIVYPYVSRETFTAVIPEENRSSENQIFTFLCDLGIPFLLLYLCSVFFLYVHLLKTVIRNQGETEMHPLILWIPITGAILHFQFFDGLLHPQISCYFHLLLGMIVVRKTNKMRSHYLCEEKINHQN